MVFLALVLFVFQSMSWTYGLILPLILGNSQPWFLQIASIPFFSSSHMTLIILMSGCFTVPCMAFWNFLFLFSTLKPGCFSSDLSSSLLTQYLTISSLILNSSIKSLASVIVVFNFKLSVYFYWFLFSAEILHFVIYIPECTNQVVLTSISYNCNNWINCGSVYIMFLF